jgi:hypothetical protein
MYNTDWTLIYLIAAYENWSLIIISGFIKINYLFIHYFICLYQSISFLYIFVLIVRLWYIYIRVQAMIQTPRVHHNWSELLSVGPEFIWWRIDSVRVSRLEIVGPWHGWWEIISNDHHIIPSWWSVMLVCSKWSVSLLFVVCLCGVWWMNVSMNLGRTQVNVMWKK